ncbi:MAG: polyphosphate:AMP phosphotransferase [Verrucomicrobia bacterium]|jgi:AMP-polyphosphate phosphotransferase|nr:polyphosphate:AMP phosphotransferase [Verrucomicrobiota bacterium]
MFETAELDRTLSKRDYEKQLPELRARLVQAQFALKQAKIPVIIVISGVDGAGKGDVVHRLNEWLDPRGVDIHAFWQETEEERERPFYWHFWQALPARGRIGLLFGSWYTEPVTRRVYGHIKDAELDTALQRIAWFEEMLAHDGALIIKLWFHLSKKSLHARLSKLEEKPETHWRVLPTDWVHHKLYDKFVRVSERALRGTNTAHAPWRLIESTDDRYRDLTAARLILEAIESRLGRATGTKVKTSRRPPTISVPAKSDRSVLDKVDLGSALTRDEYERKLDKYQARLNRLTWAAAELKLASVMVFEGWDAAGKGSCIRRVTAAIDPRLFRVIPIAAPTDEERAHHYLWRFWKHLPPDGRATLFDRSWYGRVLVERVESFARPEEWCRAYHEINDFEEQLAEHGIVISKFWIHISKDEQLRRFKEREVVPFKRHKITPEDWRNRQKWDAYSSAVHDMVTHTSTSFAPWTLVAGEDKKFARVQILKALCTRLEAAL